MNERPVMWIEPGHRAYERCAVGAVFVGRCADVEEVALVQVREVPARGGSPVAKAAATHAAGASLPLASGQTATPQVLVVPVLLAACSASCGAALLELQAS